VPVYAVPARRPTVRKNPWIQLQTASIAEAFSHPNIVG